MPSPPTPPSAPAPDTSRSPAPAAGPGERSGLAADPQSLPVDAPDERESQLPHERDESPDDETPAGTEQSQHAVAEQARRDLEEGREDTDRGPVTERVYEDVKRRKP